ncbi:MAG: amidohydrolase family protein, partial [Rhodoferax sp.]|nr:amidohydrolase family protein [Rhodoferax sp.]
MTNDLLILGGMVIDGNGTPGRHLDVAVQAGKIAFIGDCTGLAATRTIDATGLVVAPGFIDIHTHSDMSLLLDGRGQSKVSQGVTTEVTGNCGFSPFPINPEYLQLHMDLLAGIGDDALSLSWTDLEGYRQVAQERGIALNIAPLVGHGALRIAAMGVQIGAASAEQLATMQRLLGQMLDQGAFGLTTGLTYVPSRYAPTSELVSLCETLAARQRIYATHARDKDLEGDDHRYGPLNEALHLGRSTGARIQYSHAAINTPSEWGTASAWTERFDTAVGQGVDAAFDVYPYDASSSALTQYLPAWVQEGGVAAMRERLSDAATMERAEADLQRGWSANRIPWLWERV